MSVKDFYRNKVDDWGHKDNDPIFRLMRDMIYWEVFKRLQPIDKGDSILDIGCGDGRFYKRVYWAKYTGIDISKKMIELAKAKKNNIYKPTFKVMDSDKLEFDDWSFNKCVCIEVIEHLTIPDLKNTIKEIKRVCEPGSQVIITTPNLNYLWGMVPYSILPPKHRYGIRKYLEGRKKGYFDESYRVTEGSKAPHHYRFHSKFLRQLFEVHFDIIDVSSTFWYNNRVIHGVFPSLQEKLWTLSWKSKHCGAQLIFDMRVK